MPCRQLAVDNGGVGALRKPRGGDERENRTSGDSCHFHEQSLARSESFLIVLLYDKRCLAELHLYQMDYLVRTTNHQIYLSAFPGVILLGNKTPGG